ncbi:MAG: aspartate aminotransferase [Candidatus Parcubacteria bacterium]|jgi:aspartate aminotransferase
MPQEITSPAFFIGKGTTAGDLISFGSGQPDLPPPPSAFAILAHFKQFKYGAVQGELALREAIAKEYPNASAEEIVVTNGASEAIDLALRAISFPGGRVALPRPYYYSYPHNVTLSGMTPVYYDLEKGKIHFDEFEKVVQGCRGVMINSPSNPTGTVQEVETLRKIEEFCNNLGIYILTDEVYKDLIYVRENYPMKGKRVITINSFSKTYAMCGMRLGYLHTLDRALIERIVEMKSHTSMNTSLVSQAMGLAAMSERSTYVASHVPIWEKRRDIIYDGLRELELDLWRPEGAFYVLPKIKNSTRAMHDLYYSYSLITYDGVWFGAPDRLRFSYALDAEKIEEGLKRLKKFLAAEYKAY